MKPTAMERFVAKVRVIPCGGCWEWTAYKNQDGYGQFTISHHNDAPAHRWYYEQVVGPVPDKLQLDHLCRNRSCVNPNHLEPVTNRENTIRGRSPELARRRWASYTHCKHGHEYTPENTRIDTAGNRRCRQCEALRALRRKSSCPTCRGTWKIVRGQHPHYACSNVAWHDSQG